MKRIVAVILLVMSLTLLAKEVKVKSGLTHLSYSSTLEKVIEKNISINYDTDKDMFCFYFESFDMCDPVDFECDSVTIDSLRTIIKKYKEWNKQASTEQVEIQKEIASLIVNDTYFKYGDSWHSSSLRVIFFEFRSLSKDKHALRISSDVKSTSNQFIDGELISILTWKEVIALENAIQPSELAKYKAEALKKVNIEDTFK